MDGQSNHYHSGFDIQSGIVVGALDNTIDEFTTNLGINEKEFANLNSIQYNMDRNFFVSINKTLYRIGL